MRHHTARFARFTSFVVVSALLVLLLGCGGGTDAKSKSAGNGNQQPPPANAGSLPVQRPTPVGNGSAQTTIVKGVISRMIGLNTVVINGVAIDISQARVKSNGLLTNAVQPRRGMLASVTVGPNAVATNIDLSVVYTGSVDSVDTLLGEIEGLGQVIVFDDLTVFNGTDPDVLTAGHVISVSGYPVSVGRFVATRVDFVADAFMPGLGIQVMGVIENVDRAAETFEVGLLTVDYAALNITAPLQNLQPVVVFSNALPVNDTLVATNLFTVSVVWPQRPADPVTPPADPTTPPADPTTPPADPTTPPADPTTPPADPTTPPADPTTPPADPTTPPADPTTPPADPTTPPADPTTPPADPTTPPADPTTPPVDPVAPLMNLSGAVTDIFDGNEFVVLTQRVRLHSATVFVNGSRSMIGLNVQVLVVGRINSEGVLLADSISFPAAPNLAVEAHVDAVDVAAQSISLLGKTITIAPETLFINSRFPDINVGLQDVRSGSRVKALAVADSGAAIALVIFIQDLNDTDLSDPSILSAAVEGVSQSSLTVYGVTVTTSGATSFRLNGLRVGAAEFFAAIRPGNMVYVSGPYAANALGAERVVATIISP